MQPLLDADVLCYEIGYAAEAGWQQDGVPPFDYVEELLVKRIDQICLRVGATRPPILFLTGKTNFRTEIAKRRQYKERAGLKPFHYYNIKAYLQAMYDCRMQEGLEADDLMSIMQTERELRRSVSVAVDGDEPATIICSRDKDLRTVNGWFYSWELANQPEFGPDYCSDYGWIALTEKRHPKDPVKIRGRGFKFFLSQCITGDSVDTVEGLPKSGPVKAFKILDATTTSEMGIQAVLEAYRSVYGDSAEYELLEQGRLLWMVKELKDGQPVMWSFPDGSIQREGNV